MVRSRRESLQWEGWAASHDLPIDILLRPDRPNCRDLAVVHGIFEVMEKRVSFGPVKCPASFPDLKNVPVRWVDQQVAIDTEWNLNEQIDIRLRTAHNFFLFHLCL
jgi:hypothetical protein